MKKRYVLNDIYWVASDDGKILMPLIDFSYEGTNYYLNLKDKSLIEKKTTLINDVSEKYGINNLKYYPSYDFLLMYEESGINSIFINMLAGELFEPVYNAISNRYDKLSGVSSESIYANFINHYDVSLYEIKKFAFFAKAVLNALNKKKTKEESKSR